MTLALMHDAIVQTALRADARHHCVRTAAPANDADASKVDSSSHHANEVTDV